MSKAFTKESDTGHDDDLDLSSASDLQDEEAAQPQGFKNYITPAGAQKLKDELHRLLVVERPALVQTVTWAASNGDRSENGDYIYGKRRLREIDRRIRFLTHRLELAEVVDPALQKSEVVLFGAQVTLERLNVEDVEEVEDLKSGKTPFKVIQIVGIDETEPSLGKISWISPLAKAVLGHRIGEEVLLKTAHVEQEYQIVRIEYPGSTGSIPSKG